MSRDRHLEALGRRIRQLRQTRGYSQEQLAEMSGLHRNYIGGLERGERNVGVLALYRLAKALDTTCADLVSGTDG